MKICYVARHFQEKSNDDEGAISYALERLGHTVERVQEASNRRRHSYKQDSLQTAVKNCDLLLFHHWSPPAEASELLAQITIPKVFWYFDLVHQPDPTLAMRNSIRERWMDTIIPVVDLGFCTDGDYVIRYNNSHCLPDAANNFTPKLYWLLQGADERVIGRGTFWGHDRDEDSVILMAGTNNGGVDRESFVTELQAIYKSQFHHVAKGVYGRQLADLIDGTRIVVAPDSPVSDRYWSNRVYITLGFGGFLLHPFSRGLANQFVEGRDILFYRSRTELLDYIATYRERYEERRLISNSGMELVSKQHLYRHRCEYLINTVKQRFGI